jgi:hypothetical protein
MIIGSIGIGRTSPDFQAVSSRLLALVAADSTFVIVTLGFLSSVAPFPEAVYGMGVEPLSPRMLVPAV